MSATEWLVVVVVVAVVSEFISPNLAREESAGYHKGKPFNALSISIGYFLLSLA